ncbi:MAG: hypothetical protein Rpha_1815 [Candidatus Ruthia sp. Apha_13_S6]|nr:hypothetical protein [Candidatus Ruthia sp. Apha_13_S6]
MHAQASVHEQIKTSVVLLSNTVRLTSWIVVFCPAQKATKH